MLPANEKIGTLRCWCVCTAWTFTNPLKKDTLEDAAEDTVEDIVEEFRKENLEVESSSGH